MATTPPLSLSDIVDITVTVAPSAASANSFNQGLFIGPSTVIPSYGANSRLRKYAASTFSTAMLTDGFITSDPEYIAMQIYFSQNPQPSYGWVGRQDLTAVADSGLAINAAGTGWAVGDEFTVTQAGASNIIGKVTAETGGVPSTIALVQGGTGAAIASALTTTAVSPSTGTGLTVNITALGESLLDAAVACRSANGAWYGLAVNNPVDADNLALSAWADPLWESTKYYVWSSDSAIPLGTANNLALQLQALSYRCEGIYSTTQSGLYPNNIYAAAGLMGVEMGFNTGLANSFFTSAHKSIVGIASEPLTETQMSNIKAAGFNAYGNYGGVYEMFEPGQLSNGDDSTLWLFLALLVANIQIDTINFLRSLPAVTQTNTAQQQLIHNGPDQACSLLAVIGFIAPGTWTGVTFPVPSASNPALSNGQALPLGYISFSAPYSQQSAGDKAAGKAMPIYVCIITAGAVKTVTIGVNVQL